MLLLPSATALMAIAWLVHGLLLDRMSQDFVEERLHDEVAFLEHQIRKSGGKISELQTGDYFQDVFHHAFALKSANEQVVAPASWEPLLIPLLARPADGSHKAKSDGSNNTPSEIVAYKKTISVDGQAIVIIVAEDLGLLKQSQSELHIWTAIVSILLIALLMTVIWFGIKLSMRPVASLQTSLRQLQDGEIERLNVQAPDEFRPLVEQLNQLLDSLDQRLERSREALANLSHSVKTPIAAVRQTLEDESRTLNPELRQQMTARLSDIDRQLEAEMRRSRFAGPQVGKSTLPINHARDLLWMLGRLYPDKSFELNTTISDEARWPIEAHDLNEMIGCLLDNAGKWSKTLVELELRQERELLYIVVNDDGPGVQSGELEKLGERGLRLDEQTPGHGLGLAIVKDIAGRYGGQLYFERSDHGGLSAMVRFKL